MAAGGRKDCHVCSMQKPMQKLLCFKPACHFSQVTVEQAAIEKIAGDKRLEMKAEEQGSRAQPKKEEATKMEE